MSRNPAVRPSAFASCYPKDDQWKAGFYTPVGFLAPSKHDTKDSFLAFIDKIGTIQGPMDEYTNTITKQNPCVQS